MSGNKDFIKNTIINKKDNNKEKTFVSIIIT